MTGPRLGKLEKELVCKAVKQAVALQVGLEVGVVVERVWKIVRQQLKKAVVFHENRVFVGGRNFAVAMLEVADFARQLEVRIDDLLFFL